MKKNVIYLTAVMMLVMPHVVLARTTVLVPLPGQNMGGASYVNRTYGINRASGINRTNPVKKEEYMLNINEDKKQRLQLNEPVKELDSDLFNSKEDVVKHYLEAQKKLDIEDIKILWESTVQRNPVIKFALKKISLPADQRRVNSSRLAKTVSTLINGACLLPALLGADPLTASATSAGGGLASRVITNKALPKEMPLTDTELIHLARLIEELQDKIIKNYYAYKGNLKAYKMARENVLKHNRAYSNALASGNMTEILAAKSLNDKAVNNEIELRQKIKLNRLQLERLAGAEAVKELGLGNIDLDKDIELADASGANEVKVSNKVQTGKMDYSSANVQTLAEEISFELEEEKPELLEDLRLLWAAAVGKSDTIRFAILKLSNPEGEQEKVGVVKKILSPLASVAPVVGMGMSDPVAAGSTMFGGGLVGSLLSDDDGKKINEHLSKVTDTDLVMLAQEADVLQEKLVILYYDYLNAIINLDYADKITEENKKYLDISKEKDSNLTCIANVFYEDLKNDQLKAKQALLNKRVALEQFVGNEALLQVDKNIQERLSCEY